MNNKSCNVIFVYTLLVIDLVVNIADNLLPPTELDFHHRKREISAIAFAIVIIQIVAIFCVVIDLVLYFFQVSDQVRQFAWIQLCRDSEDANGEPKLGYVSGPMPQRTALKLVLDKYWWSLLVGLLYLILTIILQIIRLDPSWQFKVYSSKLVAADLELQDQNSGPGSDSLRMDSKNEILASELITSSLSPANEIQSDKMPELIGRPSLPSMEHNLLPLTVLLVHKLMSTCYYVSFVVVYRATPKQIVTRIFQNKAHQTCSLASR